MYVLLNMKKNVLFVTDCPSMIPNMCLDGSTCYTEGQRCNLAKDCFDDSDETEHCGLHHI